MFIAMYIFNIIFSFFINREKQKSTSVITCLYHYLLYCVVLCNYGLHIISLFIFPPSFLPLSIPPFPYLILPPSISIFTDFLSPYPTLSPLIFPYHYLISLHPYFISPSISSILSSIYIPVPIHCLPYPPSPHLTPPFPSTTSYTPHSLFVAFPILLHFI